MRKVLFIACSILAGLLAAIVLCELGLRCAARLRHRAGSGQYKNEAVRMLGAATHGFLRPSSLLGYELIPGSRDPNLPAPVNRYGLVGREYPLKKAPGTFRILLLGDSIAWQNGIREELEKSLNEDPRFKGRRFEIWNTGCPSYDVRRYARMLEHRGLAWEPDMVLMFLFLNDFSLNLNVYYKSAGNLEEYYFPLEELAGYWTPDPWLLRHSYLYRTVLLRINALLESHAEEYGMPRNEFYGRRYLGRIRSLCRKRNIPLAAVIFPYLTPRREWKDWQNRQYEEIRKGVEGFPLDSLDLRPFYDEMISQGRPMRLLPTDDIHPSAWLQRVIAGTVRGFLLERKKLPDGRTIP
ncbi:MAG: hypothetical protein WCU88_11905 [Elusimicrobiota bacterium]|jgi:hypothetical protein